MRTVLLTSVLLGSTLVVAACATAASTPTTVRELTTADSSAPVQAAPGQVFIVRLAANASTGYSWAWDEAAAAGVLVRDDEPKMTGLDAQRIGSGGVQEWRFRATKRGEGELRLDYRRPWETEKAPVQTVRWQIQVP